MYDWRRMTEEDRAHALDVRRALEIWKQYPIMDYGKKWDVGELSNQTYRLNVETKTI